MKLQDAVKLALSEGNNSELHISLRTSKYAQAAISASWIDQQADIPKFPRKFCMNGDNPPTPVSPVEWAWWEAINEDPRFCVEINSQDPLVVGHAEFVFDDGTTWQDHAKYSEKEVSRAMRQADYSSALGGYGLRGSEPQNVQISKRAV